MMMNNFKDYNDKIIMVEVEFLYYSLKVFKKCSILYGAIASLLFASQGNKEGHELLNSHVSVHVLVHTLQQLAGTTFAHPDLSK